MYLYASCRGYKMSDKGIVFNPNTTGGPAPPLETDPFVEIMRQLLDRVSNQQPVISLRNWFAGLAMQGELAACPEGENWPADKFANRAYQIADAMLKAKEVKDVV